MVALVQVVDVIPAHYPYKRSDWGGIFRCLLNSGEFLTIKYSNDGTTIAGSDQVLDPLHTAYDYNDVGGGCLFEGIIGFGLGGILGTAGLPTPESAAFGFLRLWWRRH
jgi:hypothetical protein